MTSLHQPLCHSELKFNRNNPDIDIFYNCSNHSTTFHIRAAKVKCRQKIQTKSFCTLHGHFPPNFAEMILTKVLRGELL